MQMFGGDFGFMPYDDQELRFDTFLQAFLSLFDVSLASNVLIQGHFNSFLHIFICFLIVIHQRELDGRFNLSLVLSKDQR